MLQKISLIIKKIFVYLIFFLVLSFIFTNTEKVKVQIIPFFYFMELRVFLLVIFSFVLGIFFSKICDILDFGTIFKQMKEKRELKTLKNKEKNSLLLILLIFSLCACSAKKNQKLVDKNNDLVFVAKNGDLVDKNNNCIVKKAVDKLKLGDKAYKLNNNFIIVSGKKLVFISKDGKEKKEKVLSNIITSKISEDEKYLYFITADNNLYFLNKKTFDIDYIHYESHAVTILNDLAPIVYKQYLLVLFNNNKIILFDKNTKNIIQETSIDKNEIVEESDVLIGNNQINVKDMANIKIK